MKSSMKRRLESQAAHRPRKRGNSNLLFEEVLALAWSEGYRYVDLGTSSGDMVPNPGLFQFKESLGREPWLREYLMLEL